MNKLDERIEERIQTIKGDLVQRVETATGDVCPLLDDRPHCIILPQETAVYWYMGLGNTSTHDGCCVLKPSGLGQDQCYIVQGHTTTKEACPVYLRVLEQLKL